MADIKVYGAPWCPDCKLSKKFLSEQRIRYDWIDIDQSQDGLRHVEEIQNGGRRIPTIEFADGSHLFEPSNDELADKLGLQLVAQRPFYDLIILGGGPAGLTASIYGAREGLDCLIIEKSALGGNAGITERIDNYPGFPQGVSGGELTDRFGEQARRYGVELLTAVGAKDIQRDGEDLCVRTDRNDEYGGHAVIIATGSSYRQLGVPGEVSLIGAGVHFCATCDGPFYKGADELLVIGGGNSGLEEGLFLAQFAKKIRVLEYGDRLKASQLLQDKVRNHPQFEVRTNTQVTELRSEANKLSSVLAKDRKTGEETEFRPQAVFVFIGLDPNTQFLKQSIELEPSGFIKTDDAFMTSLEGVFAAGDARSGSAKQIAAAVGEGAAGLLHVRQYLQKHAHIGRAADAA